MLSGGAKGIDTAAHRGALGVAGKTVVVAPSSFDRPFPEENAELYDRVLASGGGYVTDCPPGTAATRAHFFPRNQYLVALCHAVVIVEAPVRSGARNAAKQARRLGRPLLVVPGSPWSPASRGCILELQRGARLVASAREVLRVLEHRNLHPVPRPSLWAVAPRGRDSS